MQILKTLAAMFLGGYIGALAGLQLWHNWTFSALTGSLVGLIATNPIHFVQSLMQNFRGAMASMKELSLPSKERQLLYWEVYKGGIWLTSSIMSWISILFFPLMKTPDNILWYVIGLPLTILIVANIAVLEEIDKDRELERVVADKLKLRRGFLRYNPLSLLLLGIWKLIVNFPAIFVGTVSLIVQVLLGTLQACSGHKTMAISASSAIGATIGYYQGNAIAGGLWAIVIGSLLSLAGSFVPAKE